MGPIFDSSQYFFQRTSLGLQIRVISGDIITNEMLKLERLYGRGSQRRITKNRCHREN